MNEFQLITYLLSKKGEQIGVDEESLLKALKLEGAAGAQKLHLMLDEYAKMINVFGLKIQRNPLNNKWFLTYSDSISEQFKINPFIGRTRLASTFLSIVLLTLFNENKVTIDLIQKIRNKKTISDDIEELINLGIIERRNDEILLTDKSGFYINFLKFIKGFKDIIQEFEL
ncbi:MAG: hypothetical protein ACTSYF_14220 [Promethearchaeota archaeon]